MVMGCIVHESAIYIHRWRSPAGSDGGSDGGKQVTKWGKLQLLIDSHKYLSYSAPLTGAG